MIQGRQNIMLNLERFIQTQPEKVLRAMIKGGLVIEGASNKLAPLDTGNLRGTAETRWDDSDPFHPTVAVVYTAVYAARQHEEVTWQHSVGQAKFLQAGAAQSIPRINDIFQRDLHVG